MLLVFLILLIVTVCVAIVASYFLLNAENYHWQVRHVQLEVVPHDLGFSPCKVVSLATEIQMLTHPDT